MSYAKLDFVFNLTETSIYYIASLVLISHIKVGSRYHIFQEA